MVQASAISMAISKAGWIAHASGLALILAMATNPANAQQGPAAPAAEMHPEDEYEVDELVVTAAPTQPGQVIGDIPPEVQLSPAEIRAYGVSSVAELLTALEPQTSSGRGRGGGRPVTLVNGQRISSFSEIRDLPTEAILRVDILPEEVALKYGYRADQRVVNFVLRPRFRATTVEGAVRVPTAGGRETADLNLGVLRIQRETRTQLDVKANKSTPLLESERDIRASGVAGEPSLAPFARGVGGDERAFRTLQGSADTLSVNAVVSRPLAEGISATLNARIEVGETESRQGLPLASLQLPASNPFSPFSEDAEIYRYFGLSPLRRTTDSADAHLGGGVNGAFAGWRWTVTGNADRVTSQTLTDRGVDVTALQAAVTANANPFASSPDALVAWRAPDQAESVVTSADVEGVVTGSLFKLPAGDLNSTFTVGAETRRFESESQRRGDFQSAELSRDIGRAQANFDLPLASRRNDVLPAFGNLSLNANFAVDNLSDFGALTTLGGGVNWSPIESVRVIASYTREEGAPTMQQLGNPELATPNVPVLDFKTGENVLITQISGGNPFLTPDTRQVTKLGINFKPWSDTDLSVRIDWTKTKIEDVIASFPTPTLEIENAFSERFVRDESGRLISIDVRPVNFARQDREEVRWGFNYSKPLRSTRPPPFAANFQRPGAQASAGQAVAGQPPATPAGPPDGAAQRRSGAGGGFGGPGGFGRGGGPGAGALQFAVFHTWRLKEQLLIGEDLPVLDLLNGSAIGSSGGQPEHQVDVQAGVSRNGLGARLSARWQSGTEVDGAVGGQDLIFSDLTTVDVRLFADLGLQSIARKYPWLRGARATLSVENLFDDKLDVRTRAGVTPISYQPDYLDPQGRTVRISFRKLFFPPPPVRQRQTIPG